MYTYLHHRQRASPWTPFRPREHQQSAQKIFILYVRKAGITDTLYMGQSVIYFHSFSAPSSTDEPQWTSERTGKVVALVQRIHSKSSLLRWHNCEVLCDSLFLYNSPGKPQIYQCSFLSTGYSLVVSKHLLLCSRIRCKTRIYLSDQPQAEPNYISLQIIQNDATVMRNLHPIAVFEVIGFDENWSPSELSECSRTIPNGLLM